MGLALYLSQKFIAFFISLDATYTSLIFSEIKLSINSCDISPVPIMRAFFSERLSKIFFENLIAIFEIDSDLDPIAVSLLTFFATLNDI